MSLLAIAIQAQAARRGSGHGSEFSWIDYYMFQWAWHKFHWWATLIYAGYCVVIGGIKSLFRMGND